MHGKDGEELYEQTIIRRKTESPDGGSSRALFNTRVSGNTDTADIRPCRRLSRNSFPILPDKGRAD